MTINLASTHYASNIAACAKIEEKPKKCGKKEKQQLACAWDTLWCKDTVALACLWHPWSPLLGKKAKKNTCVVTLLPQ